MIDTNTVGKETFNTDLALAENAQDHSNGLIKEFITDVRIGSGIDISSAHKAVAECVTCVLRSTDASLLLTQIKEVEEYTSQHSINATLLSIILGKELGFSEAELNQLGLCAMLHDVGKMLIPFDILFKPGKLSQTEMNIMKSHAEKGRNILLDTKDVIPAAVDVAYSHHERLDGQGYPRNLAGNDISLYTRIVTIADIYDGIVSDSVYKKGQTHLDAINILDKLSGQQLDSNLVMKFIKALGIYPPGSIVEMSNGEVALVLQPHHSKQTRPKILKLLDEDKKTKPLKFVDLAISSKDLNGQTYTIKKIIKPDDYGINLARFFNKGLLKNTLTEQSSETIKKHFCSIIMPAADNARNEFILEDEQYYLTK